MSRDKFKTISKINVSDLLLDTHNPRIRHGQDQNDCIARILRDRSNFINLLKDIAGNGLSPEHILISNNDDGKWVVRDGNRRITALKLLNRPELCLPDKALAQLVTRVSQANSLTIPKQIQCLACDDEETILAYLERKHTGENAGVGQRTWSALLKSLFNLQLGVPDPNKRAAQLVLWAEERGLQVNDDFPITNLQRGLNAETLFLIGFSVTDDNLTPLLSDTQAYALAASVINSVATGEVSVTRENKPGTTSIFSPDAQLAFFRSVREMLGPPIIYETAASSEARPVENDEGENADQSRTDTNSSDPKSDNAGDNSGSTAPRKTSSSSKASWDRPCLFGPRKNSSPGFQIPQSEKKIQSIIAELRQLNPNTTPHATAMLMRALFELSDEHYRSRHGIKKKESLHQNIAASADHQKNANMLTPSQHDVVMRHTRTQEGMLHIKTLQSYIHNTSFHPNGQSLNTIWDEIGCFVRFCFL